MSHYGDTLCYRWQPSTVHYHPKKLSAGNLKLVAKFDYRDDKVLFDPFAYFVRNLNFNEWPNVEIIYQEIK